ncbi:uncharacterized protein KY384_003438 [Bacidia gigantensis]|uniref:uncharacterized protein n=1 Tax=Bacidia gigantensis TaxID=2732470 RepID=UPI001D054C28|nr:uncharacterized protein KY384_003438 [Bacidia gigantensis]KAG8531802.1 hypothetical protein KY384_003438 [Bacidia gigantensis]
MADVMDFLPWFLLFWHVSAAPQLIIQPSNVTIPSTTTSNSSGLPAENTAASVCDDTWPRCYDGDPAYNFLNYQQCAGAISSIQNDSDFSNGRDQWACTQPGTVRSWSAKDESCVVSIGCQSPGINGTFALRQVANGFGTLGTQCKEGGKQLLYEPQECVGEAWYIDVYNSTMLGGTYEDYQSDPEVTVERKS